MRNEPKPLDRIEAMRAYAMRDALAEASSPVTVSYVKRNGQESSSTGTVAFFNGREGCDTMSVTIETEDKGPRTINLNKITTITL